MNKAGGNTHSDNRVEYTVPKKGSLGLLAAGDKGLRAWRKVRDQQEKGKKNG